MITIQRYTEEHKDSWNAFVKTAKNPLFMFDRNYMDYHKDRFEDYSLMFFSDDKLIALLPLNIKDNEVFSHGGLTFGSFIVSNDMKQHTMNECFDVLLSFLKEQSVKAITLKPTPWIYHLQPAEEDLYSLYTHSAQLLKVEPSTVIDLNNPLKMPKGRKAQISRARREGVGIVECFDEEDFNTFIDLENEVLSEHHDTKAVHTGTELYLLHSRFPELVHLYAAGYEGRMIAGAVVFEYPTLVHTQYLAANDTARRIGALDLTINHVKETFKDTKQWLDFGISSENNGLYLNEGLISQKESFGGRTVVYTAWKITL